VRGRLDEINLPQALRKTKLKIADFEAQNPPEYSSGFSVKYFGMD
jgi:hypothetical protein